MAAGFSASAHSASDFRAEFSFLCMEQLQDCERPESHPPSLSAADDNSLIAFSQQNRNFLFGIIGSWLTGTTIAQRKSDKKQKGKR
jgi:hypothetical protein